MVEYVGFCFDVVYVLVDYVDVVDYCCVVVCVDEGVWVVYGVGVVGFFVYVVCEVFEVYLVDDVYVWWYDFECVECLYVLFYELVVFVVVLEF